MIDTAKHYLTLSNLKRLIEIMPISKLNILHWHLADDEAFSVMLELHPELAQYGGYSAKNVYTIEQIKELIGLAEFNGVSIVPEVNTIGGMRSWVQSPEWKNKNITINCNKT
jgi:N-acetyl-beta-hexosaminidase